MVSPQQAIVSKGRPIDHPQVSLEVVKQEGVLLGVPFLLGVVAEHLDHHSQPTVKDQPLFGEHVRLLPGLVVDPMQVVVDPIQVAVDPQSLEEVE